MVVPDEELDGARLARELEMLIADPDRLAVMAGAAKALARPNAADDVARLVEGLARRPASARLAVKGGVRAA